MKNFLDFQNLELYRDTLLSIRLIVSTLGVIVIAAGGLRSMYQLVLYLTKGLYSLMSIRLEFGDTVLLGLEFMVGGDIVGSLVAPDYYNLGLLAVIVLIRTVLSYFLTKELRALSPSQRQAVK